VSKRHDHDEFVREWLAEHDLVAVERKLMDSLRSRAKQLGIVYSPSNDRYVLGELESIADGFTEETIFRYLDGAYVTEHAWRKMPCVDFDSLDPEQVIVFGGATCRAKRAKKWLKDRAIEYPWSHA
jgi:hypothetical protein